MSRKFIWLLLGFLCFAQISASTQRSAPWKPQRFSGSSYFKLNEVKQIILPKNANKNLEAAAADLQHLISQRFENTPKIVSEYKIHSKTNSIQLKIVKKGAPKFDGFQIRSSPPTLKIQSLTQSGLINGIYGLCSETLGARWYWPQDIGLELIGDPSTRYRKKFSHDKPAFIMRQLHPPNTDYSRRNRLSKRYLFNHALSKVFTGELFDSKPQIFSTINGKKRRPAGNAGLDPQPNLINPLTAQTAAEAAINSFTTNNNRETFSLSINDNILFDESSQTQSYIEPLSYFRGRPNYTDLVFQFNNRVADIVFAKSEMRETQNRYPRYLTALAYYWAEQSPSFEIHPQVMPILTSDRAQWHDPRYRAEDKALIKRWNKSGASALATWDYYFGAPYPYPRQFNEWISESIPFLHQNGVVAFFSQLPSAWGLDGSKAWLTSQLLWDPSQKTEKLLDEYYSNFFGSAANPIRSFYELAEKHRNENAGQAMWIKFYKDEAGIEIFDTAVLKKMRQFIDDASQTVINDERRAARVKIVSDAFSFTEAYADFHRSRRHLVNIAFLALNGTNHSAEKSSIALTNYKESKAKFKEIAEKLLENPFHKKLKTFMNIGQSDPTLIAIAALAQCPGSTESMLQTEQEKALFRTAKTAFLTPEKTHLQIVNSNLQAEPERWQPKSFLKPEVPVIKDWFYTFWPAEELSIDTAQQHENQPAGLRIKGADSAKAYTEIHAVSGFNYLLNIETEYAISPDNRTLLLLEWRDRFGKIITKEFPLSFPTGKSIHPTTIKIPLKVPSRADTLRVIIDISRQYTGDFFEIKKLQFGLVLE